MCFMCVLSSLLVILCAVQVPECLILWLVQNTLAKILYEKLEEKLVPLNQTVMELRKAVDEVVKHSKLIDDR